MSGLLLADADQVLRPPVHGLPGLRGADVEAQTLAPGSVAVAGDRIADGDAHAAAVARLDCRGCAIVPGFVDCHTHLPFAGWRAEEYARKVAGEDYAAIARDGGGIRASVRALADAGDEAVLAQSAAVAAEMLRAGTTTVELKSGYGGELRGERRQLLLAARLAERLPQRTAITALLLHAVPEGHDATSWLTAVRDQLDALVAGVDVIALDAFVESIAFTNDHLRALGALASEHALHLRAHVEQLASHGSVPVALAAGARSVDHLSALPLEHVAPLAEADCAAVLLPGAELLNDERVAPGRELAAAGALCVLATDLNPGTSPVQSLPLIAGLAVRRYAWSVRQALAAITLNAAWVLGLHEQVGSIEPGKLADLVVLDGPVEQLPYRFGREHVLAVVTGGRLAWLRPDDRGRLDGAVAA